MNLETAEYPYVKKVVRELFDSHKAPARPLATGSPFYRFRTDTTTKPLLVNELREPPFELVTGYQRCNSAGSPIFYSSNRPLTAALESNIEADKVVYLSQWRLLKSMECNVAVIAQHYEEVEDYENQIPAKSRDLIEFFEFIFTRPIHETFSNHYKITAAIAEMLTAEHSAANTPNNRLSSEGHMALCYKSVVDFEEGQNYSFHSTLVNEFLSIQDVIEVKVISRNGPNICLEIQDYSNTFEDGNVLWSNDPSAVPFFDLLTNGSGVHEDITWTTKNT